MLCKNCNYILTGKENFCPNCGTIPSDRPSPITPPKKPEFPLPAPPLKKTTPEREKEPGASVFAPYEESFPSEEKELKILNLDEPEEVTSSAKEKNHNKKEKEKEKSSLGKIFLLLFICCSLAVTAFGLADYFGITPKLAEFANGFIKESTTTTQATTQVFSHEKTIIDPDVNYPMERAYVFSGVGLTLRKGPANSYSPLYNLTDLTEVKIFGGSLTNSNWVYVYCPERNSYGWLDGSFLCSDSLAESVLTRPYDSVEDIPTNYYNEEYEE